MFEMYENKKKLWKLYGYVKKEHKGYPITRTFNPFF